jgi:diaminopimelate decarboxylase
MSVWTERLGPETLAERTALLVREGQLDDERAIVVHDLDRMVERVNLLQAAFPDNALHGIAVKANPLVAVLEVLVETGVGLECASLEEVELSLAAGCPPERIIFDSPAKTVDELTFALERGIHLNLDNFDELERVRQLNPTGMGHVGLRVNPQVGSGSISMTSVAGRISKFGIPIEANRQRLLDAFARHSWLDGLHCHVGSQGCEMEQLLEAVRLVEALRAETMVYRSRPVTEMDIGGGLPTAYCDADRPPEIKAYASALADAVPSLFRAETRILTEFGRAIQAGCGWAISRVEYAKHEGGEHMAVLHLGADAFMRRVYKPEDWHHDFLVLTADGQLKTEGPRRPVTLVGPLCFGGDILARDLELPEIAAGDLVIIRDCGAYTLSMWSRHCSRGLPKVVGWQESERALLKKREMPRDLVEFWGR